MSAKAALVAAMGRLEAALAGERERWALWLPVCLGLGVALYFALAQFPIYILPALLKPLYGRLMESPPRSGG